MTLISKVETITVAQAKTSLANNPFNRRLHHSAVRRWTRIMAAGQWMLITDPIVYSKDNELLDGQHRLSAQVDSQTDQDYVVIRGADKQIFKLLNSGITRTGSDALFIAGYNYPELYASLVQQYIKWQNNSFWGHGNNAELAVSGEILDYAEENKEELAMTVNFCKNTSKRSKYFSERMFCVSYHIIRNQSGATVEEVQAFFHTLCTSDEEDLDDAQAWLQHEMIANKHSRRKLQYQNIYASIFYAWNGYYTGKFMKCNPETLRDTNPV